MLEEWKEGIFWHQSAKTDKAKGIGMINQYPAISQALEYIRALISRMPPATRLPGIRRIAEDAGVSHVTVLKAIDVLRSEGAVRVVMGQGVTTVGSPAISEKPPLPDRKWKALRDMIRRDLLTGRLDPLRPLPQQKQLLLRYLVSKVTLKCALDALVTEGTLESCKNTYRTSIVSAAGPRLSSGRIVIINQGFPPENPAHKQQLSVNQRQADLYMAIERECSLTGLKLEVVRYYDRGSQPVFYTTSGGTDVPGLLKSSLGYMLVADPIPDFDGLARYLNTFKKPMSILNNRSPFTMPLVKFNSPVRHFLTGDTITCGFDVGRYLLQLGHRSAAFISPYHWNSWSRNRLEGLTTVFKQAGVNNGIIHCVNDKEDRAIDSLFSVIHGIRFTFSNIGFETGHKATLNTRQLISEYQSEVHITREVIRYTKPLFEAALENRKATVWVCVNDNIALLALRFLADRGIEVPQRLSVIGFDDILLSLESGLSTYHFDVETIAHDMIVHITHPVWRSFLHVKHFTEINGRIVERASSAAVRIN
jgi:DNA-binding LacI/PurR family transcriptional regulator/DNA-binding transcriptional regulator YhcF (GntR family)